MLVNVYMDRTLYPLATKYYLQNCSQQLYCIKIKNSVKFLEYMIPFQCIVWHVAVSTEILVLASPRGTFIFFLQAQLQFFRISYISDVCRHLCISTLLWSHHSLFLPSSLPHLFALFSYTIPYIFVYIIEITFLEVGTFSCHLCIPGQHRHSKCFMSEW